MSGCVHRLGLKKCWEYSPFAKRKLWASCGAMKTICKNQILPAGAISTGHLPAHSPADSKKLNSEQLSVAQTRKNSIKNLLT